MSEVVKQRFLKVICLSHYVCMLYNLSVWLFNKVLTYTIFQAFLNVRYSEKTIILNLQPSVTQNKQNFE